MFFQDIINDKQRELNSEVTETLTTTADLFDAMDKRIDQLESRIRLLEARHGGQAERKDGDENI